MPGTLDESLTVLMDMVQAGQVDLMGAMLYSESLGEVYDYSSHSYGVVETVLQVPYDDEQAPVINSQVLQELRIAVLTTTGSRISELEDYCGMNLIVPSYVLCGSDAEQIQAIRDGRADMMLNTSLNYVEGVRTVARFSPKPFYFITTKGANTGLLDELNSAAISIEQSDPVFTNNLMEKYFSPPATELTLSKSEQDYIAAAGTLRVGVLTDQPPFQYVGDDGVLDGISVDLLDHISEKTGLRFQMVLADGTEALYERVRTGQVQLVAGMPYDYDLARERHLSMTRPYVSSQYLLMMDAGISEDSLQGKRLALTNASVYNGQYLGSVEQYGTTSACIQAVADGKADYTYVDAYTAQYFANMPRYRSLKLVPQTYEPRKICFGVVKPVQRELLSILNKTVSSMSEVEQQGIINQNTIRSQSLTLWDLVAEYPAQTVLSIVVFAAGVIAVLIYFLRQRDAMSRRSALELQKRYRVYNLLGEHFFEYNHQTKHLMVSIPATTGTAEEHTIQFDLSRPGLSPEEGQRSKAFLDALTSQQTGVREVYLSCIDGAYHWLRLAMDTVFDGGAPIYTLGKLNVIDDERRERESLLAKAQLDSLTHIYNAESCRLRSQEELSQMKEGELGALLLLDVDHFKEINDTYGHFTGDEALRRLSAILGALFRRDDVAGRLGGDEFMVYMDQAPDRAAVKKRCEALIRRVREVEADGCRVTISVGAALTAGGEDYESLYRRADEALYRAKESGRNGYHIG